MPAVARHLLFFLLIPALLAACDGPGSDPPAPTAPAGGGGQEDAPPPVTIRGAAVKGTVRDAAVEVFAIEDGRVGSTAVAEGVTDAEGGYRVPLPAALNGLFLVEVRGGGGAAMRCDLPAGCNDLAFGEFGAIDETFRLRTIIDATDGGLVEQDTHFFSELAAAALVDTGQDVTAEALVEAERRVVDAFGLEGRLRDVRAVDISGDGVADAEPAARLAGVLSAAILGVALEEGRGDLFPGLDALRDAWIGLGGALVVNDTGVDDAAVSLVDVLERADQVLRQAGDSLPPELGTTITARLNEALAEDVGQPTDGGEPVVLVSKLDRVKGFVSDLRTAIVAFDDPAFAGDLGDRIAQVSDELAEDAEAAADLSVRVFDAAVQAVRAFEEDPSVTRLQVGDVLVTGLASGEAGTSFTVAQVLGGFEVEIRGVLSEEVTEMVTALDTVDFDAQVLEVRSTYDVSGSMDGRMENARAAIRVADARVSFMATVIERSTEALLDVDQIDEFELAGTVTLGEQTVELLTLIEGFRTAFEEEAEIAAGSASLNLEIEQKVTEATPAPASFAGNLELALSGGTARSADADFFTRECPADVPATPTTTGCFIVESGDQLGLQAASLGLFGELVTEPGTAYTVNLATSVAGSGDAPISLSEVRRSVSVLDGAALFTALAEGSTTPITSALTPRPPSTPEEEETAENFRRLDASTLVLAGPVPGLGEETRVEVSGARTEFPSASAFISLSWGDVRIDAEIADVPTDRELFLATPIVVRFIDRNGVLMTLELDPEAADRGEFALLGEGRIELDRGPEEPGQGVVETRDDLIVVVFEDGSIETLF